MIPGRLSCITRSKRQGKKREPFVKISEQPLGSYRSWMNNYAAADKDENIQIGRKKWKPRLVARVGWKFAWVPHSINSSHSPRTHKIFFYETRTCSICSHTCPAPAEFFCTIPTPAKSAHVLLAQ